MSDQIILEPADLSPEALPALAGLSFFPVETATALTAFAGRGKRVYLRVPRTRVNRPVSRIDFTGARSPVERDRRVRLTLPSARPQNARQRQVIRTAGRLVCSSREFSPARDDVHTKLDAVHFADAERARATACPSRIFFQGAAFRRQSHTAAIRPCAGRSRPSGTLTAGRAPRGALRGTGKARDQERRRRAPPLSRGTQARHGPRASAYRGRGSHPRPKRRKAPLASGPHRASRVAASPDATASPTA